MRKTKTAIAGVIPVRWREIADAPKTLMTWPAWSAPELPVSRKGGGSVRGQLVTYSTEITESIVLLGDAYGVGLEGVRLRLKAWAFQPRRDVTATLEVEESRFRSFVAIARVDFWPSDPHVNVHKIRRLSGMSHLPTVIEGHHLHSFGDNARIGLEAFGPGPDANLPAALELPKELMSFRDFLRTVAAEFRIDGLDKIDPPDWQVMV